MMKLNVTIVVLAILSLQACSKKQTDPEPTGNPAVKKSKLELLCQVWTLTDVYADGTSVISGGTGKYRFTRQGKFQFMENGVWKDETTFDFSKDSASISVFVVGMSPIPMALKILDDNNLKTESFESGKTYQHIYKR